MQQIGLRWPDDLIVQVDKVRGDISRSDFIRTCVAHCLAHGLLDEGPRPDLPDDLNRVREVCPHPKPWKQLGYGTFCVACGKKIR